MHPQCNLTGLIIYYKMIVVLYQLVMVMYLVVTPVCPDRVLCYLKSHLLYHCKQLLGISLLCGSLPLNTDNVGSEISNSSYSGMTCYTSNALVDFLFSTELLLLVARCMGDCSSPWVHTIKSVMQVGHVHFVYIV